MASLGGPAMELENQFYLVRESGVKYNATAALFSKKRKKEKKKEL